MKRAGGVPIVADWSSNLFSRQINFSKYGLIFSYSLEHRTSSAKVPTQQQQPALARLRTQNFMG